MTRIPEPEVEPSRAWEIAQQSEGCLAVVDAAPVLVGGFSIDDQSRGLLGGFGEIPAHAVVRSLG